MNTDGVQTHEDIEEIPEGVEVSNSKGSEAPDVEEPTEEDYSDVDLSDVNTNDIEEVA